MTERRMEALKAMAASGEGGTKTAAANAIARHNAKILDRPDAVLPPGADLTKRGGPFPAREFDGRVWVAVRDVEATARAWVDERRRMLVRLAGERYAMIPTAVEVDDERQQVHVTADRDSLTEW